MLSRPFTVRAFASTPAFREATLAPGWVAAFTEGDWIGTQPLRTLAARHLLAGTMRHEFLHALVEEQAGPHAPLWLREGLVEVWSEAGGVADPPHAEKPLPAPSLSIDAVDAALAHASTEAESEAAHRAAAWYAAQLLTALRPRSRCSNGCAQAFPPESSPLSGSGSRTEPSPSGPERSGTGTSESSDGFALRRVCTSSTAAHASSRTQQTRASR